jgi:polysaccharide deacetylase 2 family uncharacterized protein YibQ
MVFFIDFTPTDCIKTGPRDMKENTGVHQIERRRFLRRGLGLVMGGLLGLPFLFRAYAQQPMFSSIVPRPAKPLLRKATPRMAIIIDDIGNSLERAREFLALGVPLTFSILPRLPFSSLLADEIAASAHEVMLHQPMEPICEDQDPGPGALYLKCCCSEIEEIIHANLDEIPQAVGVNNHMGSRFTASSKKVTEALQVISGRRLFFIDSLTTPRSTAFKTAMALKMRAGFRDVFLDTCPDEDVIGRHLFELKRRAEIHSWAIGIGHPYPQTVKALEKFFSARKWWSGNVALVHVSDLV